MASQLLVGIYPSTEVASLEGALENAAGVDVNKVSVAVAEPRTPEHEESFIEFWHVASENTVPGPIDEMVHGTGYITDFGGTDVPGITGSHRQSLTDFEEPEEVPNYLGALPVPADEMEDYNEAISEGRSVIVYTVPSADEAASAKAELSAAGFRNVRSFALKASPA